MLTLNYHCLGFRNTWTRDRVTPGQTAKLHCIVFFLRRCSVVSFHDTARLDFSERSR